LLHSLTSWFQNFWMIGIAQSTVYAMRTDLFRHLHRLPLSFFDSRRHGELMSRVTNDMENVSSTLNTSFIQIVSSVLVLGGSVAAMLWLSPLLTLLTLLVIPLMVFGMKWITHRTMQQWKAMVLMGPSLIRRIIGWSRNFRQSPLSQRLDAPT
jgi:ATP-binding cassette subfamily B multidrug efflux pump